ncbi:FAD-dependent oxidoreductase [bacterium]|nr:FAD-dependent oxidoreductase [bacterium]
MTTHHQHEVIIIGAGGAGLMAALYASQGADTAVVTKLYPTRSHTGAAQGGIGAALGNLEDDKAEWHAFDTVKGSDYLGDQDAIKFMCDQAIPIVYELENMGLPFSRTKEGRIAQRSFGGHTNNETKKPVTRAAYAADRTGHMILQTLYQQCVRNQVHFYDEYQVLDLVIENGRAAGVVAWELATGQIHTFHAKAVIFATGGYGRVWEVTSNAYAYTGDGLAIVSRRGIPLQDMEFFQFHPTGIRKMGILITEGVRGEGGVLLNNDGERFMERYAHTVKDLASRDVVSRAIYLEVHEGRGINGENYVLLDVRPETVNKYAALDGRTFPDGRPYKVDRETILKKLPDIIDFCRTYLGIDPLEEPMPVQPTAHYAMGGIPTNVKSEVVIDENRTVFPGLYAAGETACVSVHGANRLGTNSLLDIVVFGKQAGIHAAQFANQSDFPSFPADAADAARAEVSRLLNTRSTEPAADIAKEMKAVMSKDVGVFRTEEGMSEALKTIRALKERYRTNVGVADQSDIFNTDLLNTWELGCLLDAAEITAASALARKESRGAHSREDFPKRDDQNWLKHTLAWRKNGDIQLGYKPVTVTKYQPKERVY